MSSAGLRTAILLTIIIATTTAFSLKAKASTGTRQNCGGADCGSDKNCIWLPSSTCSRGLCSATGNYICQSPCFDIGCRQGRTCTTTEENGKIVGKCVNPCDTSNCEALGLRCQAKQVAKNLAKGVCISPLEEDVKGIVSGIAQKLRNAINL